MFRSSSGNWKRFACLLSLYIAHRNSLAGEFVTCGDALSRSMLLDMKQRDQEIRQEQLIGFREKKWELNHPEMILLINRMIEIDTKNQILLDKIISVCGWPTSEKFDPDSEKAAILVALHADKRSKYLPYIEDGFRAKLISSEWYARFIDAMLSSEGKPQRYGTRIHMITKEFWPIEEPSELNKRRVSIGLNQLSDFPNFSMESK